MEKALDVSKFLLVTDPCRTAATLCADPDHALFFDDVHLSEFAQSDLAVAVEALLISWDDRSSIPEIDR